MSVDFVLRRRTRRHACIRAEIAQGALEHCIAAVTDMFQRFITATAAVSRLVCVLCRRDDAKSRGCP